MRPASRRSSEHNQVETIARGRVGEGVNQGQGALFATDARIFLADERLGTRCSAPRRWWFAARTSTRW